MGGTESCILCNSTLSEFWCRDYEGNIFVRCENCGLVYQVMRKKMDYEDNYWGTIKDPDGRVRNLEEERDDKIRNWYGDDIGFVNSQPPGRILDVGCGLGFFLSAIDDQWVKYGVEISKYASDYVKRTYPDVIVFDGELKDAEYDDNYFDIVYLYHIIEHVPDPVGLLMDIRRVLKDEGTLIVGTPNIGSFCAKRFKGNFRLLGKAHINMFSKKTLTMLLKKTGFIPYNTTYPFFGTRYFTLGNLFRLIDTSKVSPPFYGNIMTAHARKVKDG